MVDKSNALLYHGPMNLKNLRLLAVVRDDLPPNHVALTLFHAGLSVYLKWKENPEHAPIVDLWVTHSFKKVIRKANATQFEQAKKEHPHIVMTESSLEGKETALIFVPSDDYPKFLNFLPKY